MNLIAVLGLLTLCSASPQGASYLAPADESYGSPTELAAASDLDNSYLAPAASEVGEELGGYGEDLDYAASDEAGTEMGIKMLMTSVPGVPGEDYPIYAEVPETAFNCEGQIQGGYYADEEAECQVFHVCGAESTKYSFLCPNGTIFNQNYFICDWWFNVDCSESAALAESRNSELAADREEATAAAAESNEAASDSVGSYLAPEETEYYLSPVEEEYEYEEALTGYEAQ